MSHSSIRCGCVSARQIFSGGKGISRSTTTERVSAAPLVTGPSFSAGLEVRRVQGHGGANERLKRLLIDLVALMEIDGAPGVAFEARVEEARRVRQRGAFGEG